MIGLAERLRHSMAAHPEPDTPFLQPGVAIGNVADLTRAAVLMPIIDAEQPRVLLTVRHAGLRAHAGQVAFPGGRLDPEDDGPVSAALREAWEEVGLPADRVDVIGAARPYATGSGYLITPVIGVIPDGLDLRPQESEVSNLFEVPLDHLLDAANHLAQTAIFEGRERRYFVIDWPDQHIWGVTAGLIINLAPRLRDAIGSPA